MVSDILKNDPDVAEYVYSNEKRYNKEDNEVFYPIVIVNDEVYDGYSRLKYHYNHNFKYIKAYINI